VRLYQGVTLGALSVKKALASTKRHPTIEDDVVIYANATILGARRSWAREASSAETSADDSVPPHSIVTHTAPSSCWATPTSTRSTITCRRPRATRASDLLARVPGRRRRPARRRLPQCVTQAPLAFSAAVFSWR